MKWRSWEKDPGIRVIAWTFHPGGDTAEWVTFDEAFRQSDVLSVHVRQSPETTRLIRSEHFALMKPDAIFINTARGAIVNESDLLDALETHRIAGAGLDVSRTSLWGPAPVFTHCPMSCSRRMPQASRPRPLKPAWPLRSTTSFRFSPASR